MSANTNPQIVKIGLVQMTCDPDPERNLKQALQGIGQCSEKGAHIVCLPELFRSLYFCQSENPDNFRLAEAIPGPSTDALSAAARESRVVLIAPLFEKRSTGIYHNSAVVIDDDGSLAGHYRKMHIPDDPGFHEKYYFTPGDLGFRTHQTRHGAVGVLICWDQWFPEAARLTALSGAQMLFYPTAIGYQEFDAKVAEKQMSAWETIQRGHAIANGVFTVAVNRVGREGDIRFWGRSFICDPFGEILYRAGSDGPETEVIDCDLSRIEETRQGWPFLRDRRTDAYQGVTRLFLDRNDP